MARLNEIQTEQLINAARAACALAFLTKEGGRRYGAAVLTRDGRMFSSGQYSSFNHVTNVHAECASLVIATMLGSPDVTALAIASSAADEIARPCGVCRQVMHEHSLRTGRDFQVIMVCPSGKHEIQSVSALLPSAWSSHNAAGADRSSASAGRDFLSRPRTEKTAEIETGDHLLLRDGTIIAMVWDPCWSDQEAMVKAKYIRGAGGWEKLPHSLTEAFAYDSFLQSEGLAVDARPGGRAMLVPRHNQERIGRPVRPDEQDVVPSAIHTWLTESGIPPSAVRLTGSNAVGLATAGSDLDLMISATADQVFGLRRLLGEALGRGEISIPADSGTWKLLDRAFPGGQAAVRRQNRFLETFQLQDKKIALIFTPAGATKPMLSGDVRALGRQAVCGEVVGQSTTVFKRSECRILVGDGSGESVRLVCYFKLANLLRQGDIVSVTGQAFEDASGKGMLLWRPHIDRIVWMKAAEEEVR